MIPDPGATTSAYFDLGTWLWDFHCRPFRPARVHSCLGNDPTCPGHDGNPCHYIDHPGSPAMSIGP